MAKIKRYTELGQTNKQTKLTIKNMKKFNKGDRVIVKKTKEEGTVILCCGSNIFLPEWLSSPNYLVSVKSEPNGNIYRQRELKIKKI